MDKYYPHAVAVVFRRGTLSRASDYFMGLNINKEPHWTRSFARYLPYRFHAICILSVLLLIITGIIGITNLDLIVSSYCFVEGQGFVYGKDLPWRFLYRYGEWPPLIIAMIALIGLLAGLVICRARKYRLACLFLVLLYLCGPGVLVNLIFKECWGRPRPVEIVEFGGTQQFVHPWQKNRRIVGKSFPSGHASVAFYMAAPFFLLWRVYKKQAITWLLFGTGYGVLMGTARILQGGHFLSDIIWSAGFVFLCGQILYLLISNRTI